MDQAEYGNLPRKLRILVAPLDWGLGHATRCIPLIRELVEQNCDIWLAGEGKQEALLRSEFPELPFLSLPGYRINFSKTKNGLPGKIFFQLPRIFSAVKKENTWLKRMILIHQFDAVISDNRFGLYHNKIPCIFITHQLKIKSPLGKWNEKILQKWNYHYINRFTGCWIPDMAEENNLAGELSHPLKKPKIPVQYIGPLSRFEKSGSEEIKDHILIVLSGPEPQRSIFENKIIKEISHYPATATIVRGLPSSLSLIPSTDMIKFYNHLPAKELSVEMEKAEWVISRSGYSTIMDIIKLQKKSIFVASPGQTEQEYLAWFMQKRQIAYHTDQNEFSIMTALEKAKKFNYIIPSFNFSEQMKKIIKEFVANLEVNL